MNLSIIIVSYKVKHFLLHCLHATLLATADIETEIIVIDNCSGDDTVDFLSKHFPTVIFLENTENVGFAKANNLALAKAKGTYLLYLNPDTLITKACIEQCLAVMLKRLSTGIIGVQMIDGMGTFLPESKRAFPTPEASFYKLFGLSKLFPRSKVFSKYALGYLDADKNHAVEVLCGAFMLMKTAIARQVGGFDERYFMYGEDIDLSYTVQQLGLQNYYLGETPIIHFKGESTKKRSLKQLSVFYHAMILFVKKQYKNSIGGWMYRFCINIAIVLRGGMAALKQLVINKHKKNVTKNEFEKTLFIGDDQTVDTAKIIWNKNKKKSKIEIVEAKPFDIDACKGVAFVFCISATFSYDEAIAFLKKHAPLHNVYWYFDGAECIISSTDKRALGEVLS